MFDLYSYLKKVKDEIPDLGISEVYRVSGLSRLDELVRDVRQTRFPCLVVELGVSGTIDLSQGTSDNGYYSFTVLDSAADAPADARRVYEMMNRAFCIGKRVLRRMQSDSTDIDRPCYGLDVSSVGYSPVGPVGMHGYGYSFGLVMTRDHEL